MTSQNDAVADIKHEFTILCPRCRKAITLSWASVGDGPDEERITEMRCETMNGCGAMIQVKFATNPPRVIRVGIVR